MSRSPENARRPGTGLAGLVGGLPRLATTALMVLLLVPPAGLISAWGGSSARERAARGLGSQATSPFEDPPSGEERRSEESSDIEVLCSLRRLHRSPLARHVPARRANRSSSRQVRRRAGPGHFLDSGRALRRWLVSHLC